ncbi:MAG: isoprenylcysteine carboxylmethyltransferase family protein [Cyclobacteriaceae bacterium]
MQIGVLIFGWSVYFFLHSLLASHLVKEAVNHQFPSLMNYYRLTYVIISTVGLLLLLYYNGSIESQDLFQRGGVVRYISLVFAAFGAIILKVSFRTYDLSSFVGVKKEVDTFVRSGLLQHVRHPIYSATILIVIGFFLFSPNLPTLISTLCIFGYLPIGIWLEERKLLKAFGEDYRSYKQEVPALVPKLF